LLKDPQRNFPLQVDGNLVEDGVCVDYMREKLGVSASTASQHLKILADAGLIRPQRIKRGYSSSAMSLAFVSSGKK